MSLIAINFHNSLKLTDFDNFGTLATLQLRKSLVAICFTLLILSCRILLSIQIIGHFADNQ